jgi:hypothetical protein
MNPSASDPNSVKRRQQKTKDVEEQHQRDLKALLNLAEFRRYVWRHMNETCGLMKSASSPNGSIQSQNIGMQDVARVLWAEIEQIDPLSIPKMMSEFHESQIEAQRGAR